MKVIAFGTLKGGTGKTTVAFNIGGILAEEKIVVGNILTGQTVIMPKQSTLYAKPKLKLTRQRIFSASFYLSLYIIWLDAYF